MKKSLLSKLSLLMLPLIFASCTATPRIVPFEKYNSNNLMQKEVYQDSTKLFKYNQEANKNLQEQIDFYFKKK